MQCLYNYIQKQVRDKVFFLHADKHQNFLQVYFNTLGVKVSYNLILSLLMGMIKHSQRTQINKFAISLQYLKKEVREDKFIFCIYIKFLKVGIILTEMARYVQNSQNRNLVIFLQYLKKTAFVFYCNAKHSDILRGPNHFFFFLILLLTFCLYEQVKDCVK